MNRGAYHGNSAWWFDKERPCELHLLHTGRECADAIWQVGIASRPDRLRLLPKATTVTRRHQDTTC